MVDYKEHERLMRSGGERILMVMLATALWCFLSPITNLLPVAEAVLVGWTVGFLVGYWLPPRPTISFLRWTSERIGMLAFFYVLVLKTPPLLLWALNRYVAYGIA